MFAVLHHRNVFLLWLGQFISLAGDWLLIVALPFYVFQLTSSILQTGGMLMAEMVLRVLLGSIAGVFVDRWDRRWTMIVSDLLRACVLLLLLLVHARDLLWLIYVVAVIQSSASQFFMPAVSAIIPTLVREQELVAANSLNSLNDAVTRFIGPPLGGILLASAVFMLGQGIMNVLLVIFVKEVMHSDAIVYGWLITSQGVGSLLGALLVGSVSKVVRPVYLLVPPYLLAGIAVLILVNYPTIP